MCDMTHSYVWHESSIFLSLSLYISACIVNTHGTATSHSVRARQRKERTRSTDWPNDQNNRELCTHPHACNYSPIDKELDTIQKLSTTVVVIAPRHNHTNVKKMMAKSVGGHPETATTSRSTVLPRDDGCAAVAMRC